MKLKYYSLEAIKERGAQYNVIFGERSNGKTYAVLEEGLKNYCASRQQLGIIRRWQDDFRGKRGAVMFDNLVNNGLVSKYSGGEWTNIDYYSGRWYLCRFEEKQNGDKMKVRDDDPFAYAFAISAMEHDKSTSYPGITTVLFDEFLTRGMYLPDEFIAFMNVLSTIIRDRNNVTIYMCGNTVNQYCPYFAEMGLTNVKKMKPGDIDIYRYGESSLTVAVEYSDSPNKGKASDLYFAFNNPRLEMITGGAWEIAIYPHCPIKYAPKDIVFTYFIKFTDDILQCEIVSKDNYYFTFIHRKTTELKDTDRDIIFSPDNDPRPNWKRRITKPTTPFEKKIYAFYVREKVFYQDNEIGEIVRNYLIWSRTNTDS